MLLTIHQTMKAQIPLTLSYQGVFSDSLGNLKPDGMYTFTFRLYDVSTGGSAVWIEIKDVFVKRGLFSTVLGDQTSFEPNVKFDKQYWLGIKPGAEAELPQRIPLTSVGYSIKSINADTAQYAKQYPLQVFVDSARIASTIPNNSITAEKIAPNQIVKTLNALSDNITLTAAGGATISTSGDSIIINAGSGGMSGIQSVQNTNNTLDIINPSGPTTTINIKNGLYLPLSGGTMTGAITNTGNPSITMGKGNFGWSNLNTGTEAFVAGRNNRARGNYSVVAGGGGVDLYDSNAAIGNYSVISGGRRNAVTAAEAMIGGGYRNTASGINSVVGGGYVNTASGERATVNGGRGNIASGNYSTVGGGESDTAGASNSTVGGGYMNASIGDAAAVGGGSYNKAYGNYATVAGGGGNWSKGNFASISGGNSNQANGIASTVGGGSINIAHGNYSVVSGGGGAFTTDSNSATGNYSIIPGGRSNRTTGHYSFASGRRAKADHNGAFVWSDTTNSDFTSSADNQYNIRASGGVRIYTNTGLTSGVTLTAGGSSWNVVSDSTLKRNIRPVNEKDILEKLSHLSIKQWSYKSQDPSIEHIGPMAQDFYSLFGLGEDDKTISTIDPDGVALSAIKALYQENLELKKQLIDLEKRIQLLED
jgi:hypothetical protein